MKLIEKSNQERMLFSSISYLILKFLVLFRVLNYYKATVIIYERSILMVEMAFNKKADFSLQAAYLSASDSQYTP